MKRIYIVSAMLLLVAASASAQQKKVLTLQEARDMAIEYNEDLQKAGISAEQAKMDKAVARPEKG